MTVWHNKSAYIALPIVVLLSLAFLLAAHKLSAKSIGPEQPQAWQALQPLAEQLSVHGDYDIVLTHRGLYLPITEDRPLTLHAEQLQAATLQEAFQTVRDLQDRLMFRYDGCREEGICVQIQLRSLDDTRSYVIITLSAAADRQTALIALQHTITTHLRHAGLQPDWQSMLRGALNPVIADSTQPQTTVAGLIRQSLRGKQLDHYEDYASWSSSFYSPQLDRDQAAAMNLQVAIHRHSETGVATFIVASPAISGE